MPSLPKSKPKPAALSAAAPALSRIPQLEAQLLAPPHNPNNLLPLLALARSQSPEAAHKAAWSLHRVFITFIAGGRVSFGSKGKGKDSDDEVAKVRAFTGERLQEYVQILSGMLRDSEPSLRVSVCVHGAIAKCSRRQQLLSFFHSFLLSRSPHLQRQASSRRLICRL
jgi:U3 small nucleolar RNA-associated protein 19